MIASLFFTPADSLSEAVVAVIIVDPFRFPNSISSIQVYRSLFDRKNIYHSSSRAQQCKKKMDADILRTRLQISNQW